MKKIYESTEHLWLTLSLRKQRKGPQLLQIECEGQIIDLTKDEATELLNALPAAIAAMND